MQESPLIGICDGPIEKKKGTYYYTNKIGGGQDLITGISAACYRCALCDGILAHVVQIYCPLAASSYHRTINVFACTNPQCYGKPESWKVLRSQCLVSEIKDTSKDNLQVKQAPVSTTDWCDEADDWGMEAEDNEPESCQHTHQETAQPVTDRQLSTQPAGLVDSIELQGLCLSGTGHSGCAVAHTAVPTFQSLYISVAEETDFVGQNDVDHANKLLQEYQERERVTVGELESCEGEGGEEKYEKTKAKHGDAVFASFMKRISLCPEQVLRYSWSASPLFISEPPSNIHQMVPPCAQCGSPRVFEFQLMPALVSLLHSTDLSSELVLEFGTVLIYTCRESCWTSRSNTPVEEFLFVQADPDQKLFK